MSRNRLTWDLESLFPGGSRSQAFADFVHQIAQRVEPLAQWVADLAASAGQISGGPAGLDDEARERWVQGITDLQEVGAHLQEAQAFVSCLIAQDVHDEPARVWESRLTQLSARYHQLLISLDQGLLALPDRAWAELLAEPRLEPIRFALEERRRRAQERMEPEREKLATALAVDGYHGWSSLYDTLSGRIRIPVDEEGETRLLSVGQVANRLYARDRAVRTALWPKYEGAWQEAADLFAATLNHLAGFRLALYRQRGWSLLQEPLALNRLSAETLEAMWTAVEGAKAPLVAYLRHKARLLGVEKLAWHDVTAPLGEVERRFTYDEGAAFILDHFRRFSDDLAKLAQRAFAERWIEAEDRPGKLAGGFCTSFPVRGQSRIFTTFSGTPDNLSTIAHELGHAYHQHVVNALPLWAQRYPMSLAETASTFAERIVLDAALEAASSREERLALLDQKLNDAVAFLMNIHARFLFERRFYEARAEGPLTVEELNRLMVEAQREAYCDELGEYHPLFWASKLHFYLTNQPFYNFPYTFGYLFSTGLYGRAQAEGRAFAQRYVALLQDTGRMTVEELAQRHLGVDLTQPDFWAEAARLAVADVERFLELG